MKRLPDTKVKLHRIVKKKHGAQALVLSLCLLCGILFAVYADVRAEENKVTAKEAFYEFTAERDFGDVLLGVFSQPAPAIPYLVNSEGARLDYDAGWTYTDERISFYLEDWAPAVTYEVKAGTKPPTVIKEWVETEEDSEAAYKRELSYNTQTALSNSKTFYISGYHDVDEIKAGFISYIEDKMSDKQLSYNDKLFNLRIDEQDMYLISTPEEAFSTASVPGKTSNTREECSGLAAWLESMLDEYMKKQWQGEPYEPNSGITFQNDGSIKDTSLTFIRIGFSRLDLDYHQYRNGVWQFWSENYLPVLTFSGSSFPLHMLPRHDAPKAKTATGDVIETSRMNTVLKDEEVMLQFGESAAKDKGATLSYGLFDREYTDTELESMSFTPIEENRPLGLKGEGLTGNQRFLYLKVRTGSSGYYDSHLVKYRFTLGKAKTNGTVIPYVGDEMLVYKIDVGDQVTFWSNNDKAQFLYTLDKKAPEIKKYDGSGEVSIEELEQEIGGATGIHLVERKKYHYLKSNSFWYQCPVSVKYYIGPFIAGKEIRKQNGMDIQILPLQEGLEPGDWNSASFAWTLKSKTEDPVAEKSTSPEEPAMIHMFDAVRFHSETEGSELFYTTNGTIPVVSVDLRKGETIPGNKDTYQYDKTQGIRITEEFARYGEKVSLHIKAVCYEEGYQAKKDSDTRELVYQVHIDTHDVPGAVMADGTPLHSEEVNSVFRDGAVRLKKGASGALDPESKINYCLLASDYSIPEVENMNQWTEAEEGTELDLKGSNLPGNQRNLYLKVKSGRDDYVDSGVMKFSFSMDRETVKGTVSMTVADGAEAVDVGDKAELISTNTDAVLLYTLEETVPPVKKYRGESSITIDELESRVAGQNGPVYFLETSSYNYLKVNGFWYQCASSLHQYTRAITVEENIREKTRLQVRVLQVQDAYEMGNYITLSLPFALKQQAASPTADIATAEDSPSQVQMGAGVNFNCTTAGSEIFYTTNGSAPVVAVNTDAEGNQVVEPGNKSTKKYDSSSAVLITEEIAGYDSSVTFMVKAVCYRNGVKVKNDSDVAKFIYHVGGQSPVDPVSAIPATNESTPAVVKEGSKIMLYCKTAGVTIYYTVDGTEPVRNEDGSPAENTYVYNAADGILVPRQQDTMFTVTAMAYAPGFAGSDIVRLVYKYPEAVSAPYATPGSGTVSENTAVTLKASAEGAIIYYETAYGGEIPKDPTTDSNIFDPSNPIIITGDTVIKAIAVSDGILSTINTFEYSVANKLLAPAPSLPSGSVISSGTSILLTAEEGTIVYYTTDGSNPADPSNTNVSIGTGVLLDGTPGSVITIRTYASKTGYSNSEVGNYSYSISNYTDAIFADKEDKSVVKNGETIRLDTDVTNAEIYYTTDGTVPTTNSAKGNTVTITGDPGGNVIVKAIAVIPGSARTAAAATFTYTIMDKLKAPQSNVPANAVFTEEGQVVLTAEAGTIYYTTDGAEPTAGSSVYRGSITVNKAMTIKAVAMAEGFDASEISTFVYQFAEQVQMPESSVESGEVEVGTQVSLSCKTQEAEIYYTTDGTDPDLDDPGNLTTYTGPITISHALTLKAIAAKSGMQSSKVLTAGFTVREPVVTEERKEDDNTDLSTGTGNGRLKSRSAFAGKDAGPSFTDIILKNSTYGVIVACEFDIIPDSSSLNVNKIQNREDTLNIVRQKLGENYTIASSYDITLHVEGEEIQPAGIIEIGLPIPSEFENAIIYVVHNGEDGTVEVLETRRSAGLAYIQTAHLSEYSIAAPQIHKEEKNTLWIRVGIIAGIAALLAGTGAMLFRLRTKYYDR